MEEKIIETKVCKHCSIKFDITDKDLGFYEKISPNFDSPSLSEFPPQLRGIKGEFLIKDLGNGKVKYLIPPPTLCPDCRQQRRLSFRNERKLYKRKCDATGKDIISIYSPDKPYKVYEQKEWWSDNWNALDYSKSFDFNRNFFEQFDELMKEVPFLSLIQYNSENSDYSNDIFYNKNTYQCFTAYEAENSLFVNNIFWSKNCIEGFWMTKSENCYNSIYLNNCFNLHNSSFCFDCTDSNYLDNCKGCKNCLFSSGLVNKEYYFLNQKIDKNEFDLIKGKLLTDKLFLNDSIEKFENLKMKVPKLNMNLTRTEKCYGDFLADSKNCDYVFDSHFMEDCKYIYQGGNLTDAMDFSITGSNDTCSLLYEGLSNAGSSETYFSVTVRESRNVFYSVNCYNSSNLFGCVGLRNKSYCIFNKEYTKEEYEDLLPKIIEHMQKTQEWGEFFPSSISPFGYNETVAQEYFPLSRYEVLYSVIPAKAGISSKEKSYIITQDSKDNLNNSYELIDSASSAEGQLLNGPIFNWSTYEPPFPKVEKIIKASMLPEDISKIPDDILNWAVECEITKKPFKIIKQELDFYRKHKLPIPKRHPDQRHLDRLHLRNPRKLFDRICDKCGKNIKTTYSPDRKEIVYCEGCYLEII